MRDRPYRFNSFLATGFSEAFPGIKPHLLTLTNNFLIPIYRDWFLSLGISSVSKESCSNILKAGPGTSITIVVGGASESLNARPGTADLTLRRRCVLKGFRRFTVIEVGICRLGFIKVAIQHGLISSLGTIPRVHILTFFSASLVPVFSFGENDVRSSLLQVVPENLMIFTNKIFNQIANEKGTTVHAIQSKFQAIFGFTLPLFHGRGLLNCEYLMISSLNTQLKNITLQDNVGLMPYRRPMTVVCKCDKSFVFFWD
jgi:2-acylglycerol O-acyltransferase 2